MRAEGISKTLFVELSCEKFSKESNRFNWKTNKQYALN